MSSYGGLARINSHKNDPDKWRLYGVILEPNPGDFIIKVGVSNNPFKRLCAMRSFICLPPSLIVSPEAPRLKVYAVERDAHAGMFEYGTFGEWFRFSADQKRAFHEPIISAWGRHVGGEFEWFSFPKEGILRGMRHEHGKSLVRAAGF